MEEITEIMRLKEVMRIVASYLHSSIPSAILMKKDLQNQDFLKYMQMRTIIGPMMEALTLLELEGAVEKVDLEAYQRLYHLSKVVGELKSISDDLEDTYLESDNNIQT